MRTKTTFAAQSRELSLHFPGQSDAAERSADGRALATRKFAPLVLVARPLVLSVRERALEAGVEGAPAVRWVGRTALSPRSGRMSALARIGDESATLTPNVR